MVNMVSDEMFTLVMDLIHRLCVQESVIAVLLSLHRNYDINQAIFIILLLYTG